MDTGKLLADRTKTMKVSALREILKIAAAPEVVSLAGGLPAPESYPLEVIRGLMDKVMDKYSSRVLQYDCTEGFGPLREVLSGHLGEKGIPASADEIVVTNGSQGVLDALGKVLISPGDKVAVEAPTYLGALQAFNPYGPEYILLDTDDEGLLPGSLERVLKEHRVKFVYLVPTFQNPTGRTIPLKRRERVAELLKQYDVLLVEDDPYSALRYSGEPVPSIKSLAPENVVYTSTLSKVFAAGLRIGYVTAPADLNRWLVLAKQGTDLHTSTFNQALAAEYIAGGYLDKVVPKIIDLYRPRQQAMLQALAKYMPQGFTWTRPEGGMFIWVTGPLGLDVEQAYAECIERNTAFVPGRYFFANNGQGKETMRLNFTNSEGPQIDQAVRTIGECIRAAGG